MPTTFNVISIGNLADIDTTEGNTTAESAAALVGLTFGGAGDSLVDDFVSLSLSNDQDGDGVYDMNNFSSNDSFSIDGGAPQTFDGTSVYNATVTFVDGTTASYTAVLFQDTDGNSYLAPEFSANADQATLEFGPIRSITLDSLAGNRFSGMTASREGWDFVTCFVRGMKIITYDGLVAVEDLQIGQKVLTADNGFQAVRWIGHQRVEAKGKLAPVRFKTGALGNNEELWVSQQHRMLLSGWRAELYLGREEVLVPAKYLVNGHNITCEDGEDVEYYHIMFDRHELIYSAGIASESFNPGLQALNSLERAARDEVLALFPHLKNGTGKNYGSLARRSVSASEARLLA
ncbi:MAG: Hint domain-containing protein [Pseudomonadota bacterium]